MVQALGSSAKLMNTPYYTAKTEHIPDEFHYSAALFIEYFRTLVFVCKQCALGVWLFIDLD
jgi:hypothetical protein